MAKGKEPTPDKIVSREYGYTMVYNSFLESDLLDYYEKIVFISIKRFANNETKKAFPSLNTLQGMTGMSKEKVRKVIISLEQKGVLKKTHRSTTKKGNASNLYTLYDYPDLWKSGTVDELTKQVKQKELEYYQRALEANGYKVTKEKELTPAPTKVTEVSTKKSQSDIGNDTSRSNESQVERYTIDQIRQIYDYEILVNDNPMSIDDINAVMVILHNSLNTNMPTIRIGKENKPTMVVVSKLMKLTYMGIKYAIDKFREQTERITNPMAYMLTILYSAEEQLHLDVTNKVNHDMVHWKDKK